MFRCVGIVYVSKLVVLLWKTRYSSSEPGSSKMGLNNSVLVGILNIETDLARF